MSETPPIPSSPEQELEQYNLYGYQRLASDLISRYRHDKPRYIESLAVEVRNFFKPTTDTGTKLAFINLINDLLSSQLEISTIRHKGYFSRRPIKVIKNLNQNQIQVLELSYGLNKPNQPVPTDKDAAASINMRIGKFRSIKRTTLGLIYNSSQFAGLLKFMHIDPASLKSLNISVKK